MHAEQLCHKIINSACVWMHKTRRETLGAIVLSAIESQRLTVTSLGRAIKSDTSEKHNIKRADRLLSNPHLYQEHTKIYHTMTQRMIGHIVRPIILIDWSDLDGGRNHFLLRGAVSLAGRSLTLYEEVHTLETKEKPQTHQLFIRRLKQILPLNCRPIVITDAGFRTPWFKLIEKQGWDWVGRIRNRHMVKPQGGHSWFDCKRYYSLATTTAKFLGAVQLTRNHPFPCQMVIYKAKPKGRVRKNLAGERTQSKHSKVNAKREREPWLLATSLPVTSKMAKKVVKLYRTRMQIEEAFRDTKSVYFGLGLALNKTQCSKRLQILLLIGMLATWVLWILGSIAKATNQHRQYQANTVTKRNVLSVIFLGIRVANDRRFNMTNGDILRATQYMCNIIESHTVDW